MNHKYTKDIMCPYCNHEVSDSYEYNDYSDENIECPECGEEFYLEVYTEINYSTSKVDCTGLTPSKEHEYDEPTYLDVSQADCDSLNLIQRCGKTDYTPRRYWSAICKKCEHERIETVGVGEKCPF